VRKQQLLAAKNEAPTALRYELFMARLTAMSDDKTVPSFVWPYVYTTVGYSANENR
jgi:hypothetical protein